MKKGSLNSVFGLPTILTVLIVLSVLGFASLSLVSANAQHKGLIKSLSLLEGSYQAEAWALESVDAIRSEYQNGTAQVPLGADLTKVILAFSKYHPEAQWDHTQFTLSKSSGKYTVTITVVINPIHTTQDFTILSQTLSIENDQDYTQDGDPIWKGP